ncbi:MAG: SDR family oxidoreductase [Pseudorhodoplanes sp.]|nr:SDR family oxidoreductase [Pseudorhodoplanes sp.]
MQLRGAVAVVTGANRGLGRALARGLVRRGARVYGGARRPDSIVDPGVVPVKLDVTSALDVAAAAASCGDVTLLVNNAGFAAFTPLLEAPSMDNARREMETNYFGVLAMCRAFAPVLARNGGGAIVNILSVVSWFNAPMQGSYCASKAAALSLTDGIRHELRGQGTRVTGVHAGYIDTDMAAGIPGEKSSPDAVATAVLDGVEAGVDEVLADKRAHDVRSALLRDPHGMDGAMRKLWEMRGK